MKVIPVSDETHALLKKYCASKGEFLSHVGNQIIKNFLETQHLFIESEGEMIIEGEKKRPRTIVEVLKEDEDEEEPRTVIGLPKDREIMRKGNRLVVKKKRG